MKRSSGFSISNFFTLLLIFICCYLTYVYVPIIWKKNSLSNLVREECYGGKTKSEDGVREAIKLSAASRLGIDLAIEDIDVKRLPDRIQAKVTWRPTADLIIERPQHKITVDEEVVFY
jgi:hypothetical protein